MGGDDRSQPFATMEKQLIIAEWLVETDVAVCIDQPWHDGHTGSIDAPHRPIMAGKGQARVATGKDPIRKCYCFVPGSRTRAVKDQAALDDRNGVRYLIVRHSQLSLSSDLYRNR